jgi:hypothetical protein
LSRRRAVLACACAAGAAASAAATAEALPEDQRLIWSNEGVVPPTTQPADALQRSYLRLHGKALRTGAEPGRNILLRGVKTRDGRVRAARREELRRSIGVLERMTAPAPETGGSAAPNGGAAPSGALEGIAACESGGDPTAVGGGGLYRGKYQFSHETWRSVGGTGDPAAAPEAEQDGRAALLLAREGAGHWPACGG